jgi:c-di-GMP-binding flagellar brake protein YcgR
MDQLGSSVSWLKVKQGRLFLCYPTLPDLGCLLQAISETGCRGMVMFKHLAPEASAAWKKILAPLRPIGIKMDLPPWLDNFEADVLIVEAQHASEQTEIELAFKQLAPESRKLLQQSVLAIAMKKVRKENQADPASSASDAVKDITTLLKLKKVGEVLVHMGKLKPRQLEDALARARATHEKLGRYLVRSGLVAPDVLCRALALQAGLPMTDLSGAELTSKLAILFDAALMTRHCFVPFDEAENIVCVAAASSLKTPLLQELEKNCGKKVELFLAEEELITKLLDTLPENRKKARQHARYSAAFPVRYQFCNRLGNPLEEARYDGLAGDISEGGVLIEGPVSAQFSSTDFMRRGICLRMDLGAPPLQVQLFALLRSMKEKDQPETAPSKGKIWRMGVEFLDVTTTLQRRLKELCLKAAMVTARKG